MWCVYSVRNPDMMLEYVISSSIIGTDGRTIHSIKGRQAAEAEINHSNKEVVRELAKEEAITGSMS